MKYIKKFEHIKFEWDMEEETFVTKVIKVTSEYIEFDNGIIMLSEHEQNCCESHYLHFGNLTIDNFEDLEFDLTNDNFFTRIDDYGISLNPINGHPIRIPGYGINNGNYSSDLTLVLIYKNKNFYKSFDISDCQNIEEII